MTKSTETFTSTLGQQTVTVWIPDAGANGMPLLVVAGGVGQTGTMGFAPASIGEQLNQGKQLPFVVVNIHKPNDGDGSFQPSRYKDTIDWALTKYPVDPSRVYATGLSLSGGAIYALMADGAYSKKIAAFVPVCGTKDATYQSLIAGEKESQAPFRAYGSSTDDNPPTREAFTTYLLVSNGFDPEKILTKYGTFIDTKTGHGGVWKAAYDFTNSDLFSWLLTKTRAVATPPPVVVPPPVVIPPIVVPPPEILIGTYKVYSTGRVERI